MWGKAERCRERSVGASEALAGEWFTPGIFISNADLGLDSGDSSALDGAILLKAEVSADLNLAAELVSGLEAVSSVFSSLSLSFSFSPGLVTSAARGSSASVGVEGLESSPDTSISPSEGPISRIINDSHTIQDYYASLSYAVHLGMLHAIILI